MTGIFPSTEVHLLSGCPIEKNHGNTIFFTSLTEQINYFSSFDMRVFYNISYQRENKNVFRIECPIADVLNCNYMMFKNDAFENKWFYAFIDKINYINNQTTEIEYTIDVLQTWYFNFDFHQSFVEREHTLSDNFGENIIAEPLKAEDYITAKDIMGIDTTPKETRYGALIYYVPNNYMFDPNHSIELSASLNNDLTDYNEYIYSGRVYLLHVGQDGMVYNTVGFKGGIQNSVYTGATQLFIPIDTTDLHTIHESAARISYIIQKIIGPELLPQWHSGTGYRTTDPIIATGTAQNKHLMMAWGLGGKIVDIQMIPTKVWNMIHSDSDIIEYQTQRPTKFISPSGYEYTPKNNKTFQFPYQKIIASNNNGERKTYLWENFDSGNADFNLQVGFYPSVSYSLYPANYNCLERNVEEGITVDPTIPCSWSEDSYSKWYNANKNKLDTSAITGALTLALGAALMTSGSVFGASMSLSGVSKITTTIATMKDKRNVPDELYGSYGSDSIKIKQNRTQPFIYSMQIKAEQAKIIDDFFTMYGYQVNELKIPNVFNPSVFSKLRPYWNYVKTQNAVITPKVGMGLPAEAEQKICEIFNNGVTFWNPTATVGDYSQNNAPVI